MELIEALRTQDAWLREKPERLFNAGEQVQITNGPFAGLQAIYQMDDGERRAMVLIEILGKSSRLTLAPGSLRKVA